MTGEWDPASIDALKASVRNAVAMGPFGSRIRTDNFVAEGVPVIRGGNLNTERFKDEDFVYLTEAKADELRASNASALDIVITHRGTLGQVGIIPHRARYPRYVVSQSQLKVTIDRTKADPYFVFYFLRSPHGQHQLLASSSQTGVPAIASPTRTVKEIQVPCPPLDEQRAIAHILGTLDDKIELNRRISETLEAIARAVFKSWFVDFDPVRAKAEGRDTGLPPHITELFPSRFEDSELGPIPAGWEVRPLPEVIAVNPRRSLKKGQTAPYLKMAGMPTASARAVEIRDREFGSGTRFKNGDTLLARITPCLENGKTCFVDFLDADEVGWGSTEYIVLRPKESLPSTFGYYLARTEEFRSFAISNMTGTSGRQRVPANSFDHFSIVAPHGRVAARFGELAATGLRKMKANDDESSTLAELRDALLPKLISGEIRVKEAEKHMEAAL